MEKTTLASGNMASDNDTKSREVMIVVYSVEAHWIAIDERTMPLSGPIGHGCWEIPVAVLDLASISQARNASLITGVLLYLPYTNLCSQKDAYRYAVDQDAWDSNVCTLSIVLFTADTKSIAVPLYKEGCSGTDSISIFNLLKES